MSNNDKVVPPSDPSIGRKDEFPESEMKGFVEDVQSASLESEQFLDLLVNKVADVAVEKVERTAAMSRNRTTLMVTVGGAIFISALAWLSSFAITTLQDSLKKDQETLRASLLKDQEIVVASLRKDQDILRSSLLKDQEVIRKEILADARRIADEVAREAARVTVDAVVPAAVSLEVEKESSVAQKNWKRFNQALQLRLLSQKIDDKNAFSEDEANQAIKLLESFAVGEEYREFAEFNQILEEIVDHFQAAGRDDLVRSLEPVFGDVMLAEAGIVLTMTQSLGRDLISFAATPGELGNGKLREDWDSKLKRYHQYADAMRRHRFAEVPYIYDVIIACMEEQPGTAIRALLGRSAHLMPSEVETAGTILAETLDESWRNAKGHETRLARDRAALCLGTHQADDPTGVVTMIMEIHTG